MMRRIGDGIEVAGGSGAAEWLCLAAAPSFALMALLTGFQGSGAAMPCLAMPHESPLGGMAPMYALMAVFHLAPWLRLAGRARGA